MAGGINGPPTLNGAQFAFPRKTLAKMRNRLIGRLGFGSMSIVSPGVEILIDDTLMSVNEHIYRKYHQLRLRRWWKITLSQGSRFYDIPYEGGFSGQLTTVAFNTASPDTIYRSDAGDWTTDGFAAGQTIRIQGSDLNDSLQKIASVNAATITLPTNLSLAAEAEGAPVVISEVGGFKYMNQGRVYSSWIKEDDSWSEIKEGIDPALFNQTNESRPNYFDLREYIEYWPAPDKAYEGYLYGEVGLTPFEHDSDYLTVDEHTVFTLALAKLKFHYRQSDYQDYYQEFNDIVKKLNTDSFNAKRYVPDPCERPRDVMSMPKATWRP